MGVPEELTVPDCVGVKDGEGVKVGLEENVPEGVEEGEGEGVNVGLGVGVTAPLPVFEGVCVAVELRDSVVEPVMDDVLLTVPD